MTLYSLKVEKKSEGLVLEFKKNTDQFEEHTKANVQGKLENKMNEQMKTFSIDKARFFKRGQWLLSLPDLDNKNTLFVTFDDFRNDLIFTST